jgi:hypothetical protein
MKIALPVHIKCPVIPRLKVAVLWTKALNLGFLVSISPRIPAEE